MMQSLERVVITGTVQALGGSGGTGGAAGVDVGGNGGDGGSGRIRIDGSLTGVVTNPVAYQELSLPTIIDPLASEATKLTSDIEYSCAYKEQTSLAFLLNFSLGVLLLGIPMVIRRRQYD